MTVEQVGAAVTPFSVRHSVGPLPGLCHSLVLLFSLSPDISVAHGAGSLSNSGSAYLEFHVKQGVVGG